MSWLVEIEPAAMYQEILIGYDWPRLKLYENANAWLGFKVFY